MVAGPVQVDPRTVLIFYQNLHVRNEPTVMNSECFEVATIAKNIMVFSFVSYPCPVRHIPRGSL